MYVVHEYSNENGCLKKKTLTRIIWSLKRVQLKLKNYFVKWYVNGSDAKSKKVEYVFETRLVYPAGLGTLRTRFSDGCDILEYFYICV